MLRPRWLCFGKIWSKVCVLCQIASFCRKLLKTACFMPNGFNLGKAGGNWVFWPKWLYFGKSCLKLCFSAKIALDWQDLLKTVLFGQNGFILAIACQNSTFPIHLLKSPSNQAGRQKRKCKLNSYKPRCCDLGQADFANILTFCDD